MRRHTKVVLSEGVANIGAERWRGVVLIVIGAVILTSLVALEIGQRREAVEAEHRLTKAGQYVYIARAAVQDTSLDAKRCVALGANPAVVASGGFVAGGDKATILAKAPGWRLSLRAVTGAMPQLMTGDGPGEPVRGVAALSSQAEALGLVSGSRVVLDASDGAIALSLLEVTDRIPDPGAWLIHAVAPQGGLDQCWAEFQPGSAGVAASVMRTWLSTGPGDVVVTPLLPPDQLRIAPITRYETRASRYAGPAAGAVLGAVHSLVLWFRRSEVALYRSVGLRRTSTAAIYAMVGSTLIAVSTVIGLLFGAAATGVTGPPISFPEFQRASLTALVAALMATLLMNAAVLAISSGSISDYIRDRL